MAERSGTKGSMTVEAALIVPVLLFILFLLIYIFLLLYQWALLTKTASYAAQQGAEVWPDSRKNIGDGAFDPGKQKDSLYYHILDDSLFGLNSGAFPNPYREILLPDQTEEGEIAGSGTLLGKKFTKIRGEIGRSLSKGLLQPVSTELQIEYSNILVRRRLTVMIRQDIQLPFGNILRLSGKRPVLTLTGKGTAWVAEPAEYIRNIDLGIEYAYRAKEAIDVDGMLNALTGKIKDTFSGKK